MFAKIYLVLFSIVVLASCSGTKHVSNAVPSGKQFYKEYSQRLGFSLTGKENKQLIMVSSQWLGTPYQYGGCTMSGTDCSCFVIAVFKEVYNLNLPRSSSDMYEKAKKIKHRKMMPGDLVFFTYSGNKPTHVGIYLGSNKFIHASTSKGVVIDDLTTPHFQKVFIGAGRYYSYG